MLTKFDEETFITMETRLANCPYQEWILLWNEVLDVDELETKFYIPLWNDPRNIDDNSIGSISWSGLQLQGNRFECDCALLPALKRIQTHLEKACENDTDTLNCIQFRMPRCVSYKLEVDLYLIELIGF